MLLEALEDKLRESSGKTEDFCPKDLTIEHVMPQHWHTNWPLPDGTSEEEIERREVVLQTLGNLTLVNQKLNPSLSNSAWSEKKPALIEHSVLSLKNDIVAEDDWQEEQIVSRSERLAEIACELWPRP